MQSNLGEELNRYGGMIGRGLKALGSKASQGLEDLKVGAAKKVEGLKKDAEAALGDLKTKGEKQLGHLKDEVLPSLKTKAGNAAGVVAAHVDLTARRCSAEAREAFSNPDILDKEKATNFDLVSIVVKDKVRMNAAMRKFLASDSAKVEGFDNTGEVISGVPLFPAPARLAHIKDQYVPVRVFVSLDGLKTRVYDQTPPEDVIEGKAQYSFKEERATTAEDLFQLAIKPEAVTTALEVVRSSEAFKEVNAPKRKTT